MNKDISIQLDGMRGLAALYILAHHYFKDIATFNIEGNKTNNHYIC